jgi:acetyl-CoA C-acetyltransferase
MREDADSVPVIIGIGQINDRPADPAAGLDSLQLMEAALRLADEDAGGGWLARLDSLAVVDQISFPGLGDCSKSLANMFGVSPRFCYQTAMPMGDSPILLLNEAANRIGSGEVKVAAVVGGEALRTAAQRAAAGLANGPTNATRATSEAAAPPYHARYGLVAPIDVYPLYDNAGRAAYGQSLAEGQAETGIIWSGLSKTAADNPGAWLRKPLSPEEIQTLSASNRPLAFPYTKLMVANSSVNQGAGFLVTSLATALDAGIAEERLIYVGRGAAAHECDDVLQRERYDFSAAMQVSLGKTLELNGLTADALDAVELYSCFPCVPKMARRVLGWPAERPASVVGGLTFGGGPIGNYMSHAVVQMVARLREQGGTGLLFANGGFATHNHSIILSRSETPPGIFPHDFDFQGTADAVRAPAPSIDVDYQGPATIETYTLFHDRNGEVTSATIVARTESGARTLATIPATDAQGIQLLTGGMTEPVGSGGVVRRSAEGTSIWNFTDFDVDR